MVGITEIIDLTNKKTEMVMEIIVIMIKMEMDKMHLEEVGNNNLQGMKNKEERVTGRKMIIMGSFKRMTEVGHIIKKSHMIINKRDTLQGLVEVMKEIMRQGITGDQIEMRINPEVEMVDKEIQDNKVKITETEIMVQVI